MSNFSFLIFHSSLQAMPAVVGSNGLEPSTSRLSGVRSNHLSYEPISVAVRLPSGQTYLLESSSLARKYSRFRVSEMTIV